MTPKLDPLLGLHFRNVLGDALRAERRFARRLSHVTRRPSRHRVRPELVYVLRDPSRVVTAEGKGRDDLLWPSQTGSYLAPPSSTDSWLSGAVARCRESDKSFPRITAHALRHTAASLAISAGANVEVVQRMLGHASAAMTLDVYADLFDSDLDAVADRLDTLHRQASER